jgi:multidrug resistance efflux pump
MRLLKEVRDYRAQWLQAEEKVKELKRTIKQLKQDKNQLQSKLEACKAKLFD